MTLRTSWRDNNLVRSEDEDRLISRWHGQCLQGWLSSAGLWPGLSTHFHGPGLPPGAQTSQLPHTRVLTYNQLLSFSQKSPKVPFRVRSWRSPWSFHDVALWRTQTTGSHRSSQLSAGGAVMPISGGKPGVRTEPMLLGGSSRPQTQAATLPPRSACDSTLRAASFGLRKQKLQTALRGPRHPQSPQGLGREKEVG